MSDLRLKFDELQRPKDEQIVQDRIITAISLCRNLQSTRGDVNSRGLAIAITHLETAALWVADATKVEEG